MGPNHVTSRNRQAWTIVGALFVMWFFVWGGGLNTGAVFFPPLLKQFGWSRAKLSAGFAVGAVAAGLVGPLVGWLLDRFDARNVMVAGVAMIAVSYLGISRVHTFSHFVALNVIVGAGFAAATGIPTSIVIANWFNDQRGFALGIAFAGASIGGSAMTIVASRILAASGWRAGYVAIAVPMLVIAIPLVIAVVRTRPGEDREVKSEAHAAAVEIPGLEIKESMAARSFWLITLVQFLGATLWTGLGQHFVAYLIGVGYSAAYGAYALSIVFLFTTAGTLAAGPVADRVNARRALAYSWIATTAAVFALMAARHGTALGAYVVLAGLAGGAVGTLTPLVIVESMGLKRLGSLMGISGLFGTMGYAVGPVLTGRIFDISGSYSAALWLFVAISIACAASVLACRPYEEVQAEAVAPARAAG